MLQKVPQIKVIWYFSTVKFKPGTNKSIPQTKCYLDAVVVFGCCGLLTIGTLVNTFCLYNPRGVIFLGQLIPEKYYVYFPMGIIVALFHSYLVMSLSLNLAIISSMLMIFLYSITVVYAQELNLSRLSYRTCESLRNLTNLMHSYRCLHIIYSKFEMPFGPYIVFYHVALTILPVYTFFVLICYGNKIDIVAIFILSSAASVGLGIWLFVLQLGKYLCVKGGKTLSSWRKLMTCSDDKAKLMRIFKRSFRPLLLCCGKSLRIQRITQFNYIKGNLRGVMRLVLTLPNT